MTPADFMDEIVIPTQRELRDDRRSIIEIYAEIQSTLFCGQWIELIGAGKAIGFGRIRSVR